ALSVRGIDESRYSRAFLSAGFRAATNTRRREGSLYETAIDVRDDHRRRSPSADRPLRALRVASMSECARVRLVRSPDRAERRLPWSPARHPRLSPVSAPASLAAACYDPSDRPPGPHRPEA